ncbi:MAG TPA: riboflavin synthase [Phenylobacterium sp.]|jgi:riboflavin synthase|nr:riboflavin synthase [Phenylobacterium sp.]
MFTGLIEDLGAVAAVTPVPQGMRLLVRTRLTGLTHGASIAVDGACLTAIELPEGAFAADLSAETLQRTTLGALKPGDPVNLERPLALGDRLGGHMVLGHVDGVGQIVARETVGNGERVTLKLPEGLAKYVVEKGSIALDGISLTVNSLKGLDEIELFIIPETLRATTWGAKPVGAKVNVEADILGKHVARLLQFR